MLKKKNIEKIIEVGRLEITRRWLQAYVYFLLRHMMDESPLDLRIRQKQTILSLKRWLSGKGAYCQA